MYAQDYDERLPRVWTPKFGINNGARDWKDDIQPYVKNWDVYRCPSRQPQYPGYGYNVWFATEFRHCAAGHRVRHPADPRGRRAGGGARV